MEKETDGRLVCLFTILKLVPYLSIVFCHMKNSPRSKDKIKILRKTITVFNKRYKSYDIAFFINLTSSIIHRLFDQSGINFALTKV